VKVHSLHDILRRTAMSFSDRVKTLRVVVEPELTLVAAKGIFTLVLVFCIVQFAGLPLF